MNELKMRLLSVGGNFFFGDQLEKDPDCKLILETGQVFSPATNFIEMQPHRCHWNVAELYDNSLINQIVIGYALNFEEYWFQHTWGLANSVLVETSHVNCVGVKLYFGAILADPLLFVNCCKQNPPGGGKVRRIVV